MRYESKIFLEKHNCYKLYYRNVLPDTDLNSLIPVESKNSQIQARKQYICWTVATLKKRRRASRKMGFENDRERSRER